MVKTMGRPKGIEPPKANVASRVSQELYTWFEDRAKAEKRTVSQLVSFAMEEYRDRHEGLDTPMTGSREAPPADLMTPTSPPRASRKGRV